MVLDRNARWFLDREGKMYCMLYQGLRLASTEAWQSSDSKISTGCYQFHGQAARMGEPYPWHPIKAH